MFVEQDDYLFMMGLLKEIAEIHSLRIFAVCLMPNHQHILMSPEEENLYDAMRDLFSRYVMRFNIKYVLRLRICDPAYPAIVDPAIPISIYPAEEEG